MSISGSWESENGVLALPWKSLHMVEAENVPLAPGPAFAFVQAIEAVNLGKFMYHR